EQAGWGERVVQRQCAGPGLGERPEVGPGDRAGERDVVAVGIDRPAAGGDGQGPAGGEVDGGAGGVLKDAALEGDVAGAEVVGGGEVDRPGVDERAAGVGVGPADGEGAGTGLGERPGPVVADRAGERDVV